MAPKKRSSSKSKKETSSSSTSRTVAESAALATASREQSAAAAASATQSESWNPKTTSYEWGGPIGALCCVLLLPSVVFIINAMCGNRTPECEISYLWDQEVLVKEGFSTFEIIQKTIAVIWQDNFEYIQSRMPLLPRAIAILLCWYAFHCVFYLIWPLGGRGPGMKLRNGKSLMYNFNALWAMIVSYVIVFGGHYLGYFNATILVDLFIPLMVGSVLLAVVFSIMLYVGSYRAGGKDKLTAVGGNTGNAIYDFWIGRELNPRLGELDFKWVFELRPGLIGWTILSWCFALYLYKDIITKHNQPKEFSHWFVSDNHRKLLPCLGAALCNFIYVIDALNFEPGNVTMMDIVYDGFGFMLCFGDIAWVPFLYTLQCKFLFIFPQKFSNTYLLFCVAVYSLGYLAFRLSNSQKDRFRKNPSDPRNAHLQTMKTKRGTSLIVSSWWGICRHPNYVGDWLMVVGTSLFCGTSYLLPWFQPVYFAILLIHRQLRDEEWMLHKYGNEDWEAYCKRVPYRLIPYIY